MSHQRAQQLPRHERGFRFHDGVQEPGLRRRIHRLAGIERGLPQNANAGGIQRLDPARQHGRAVADVRSQRDVDQSSIRHPGILPVREVPAVRGLYRWRERREGASALQKSGCCERGASMPKCL